MRRLVFFSFIIVIITAQCSKSNSNNVLAIFPLNNTLVNNDFEKFVDTLYLIPIIESAENFFFDISKILIDKNNNFILLDGGSRVKVFSPEGFLIRDIGARGRGPGEYSNIEDICLTADGDYILILQLGSIMKFRISDGAFLTKLEISRKNFNAICSSGNGGFFLFSTNPVDESDFSTPFFALSHFKESGKLIKEFMPRKDFVFTQGIFTQSYDKSTIMRPQEGDNVVYKIRKEVVPFLKIDFQHQGIPNRYIFSESNNLYEGMKRYLNSGYYKLPIYIQDTEKYVYFSSIGPSAKQNDFLFNIENCNGIRWVYEPSKSDPLFIMASDNNFFYTIICIDTESLLDTSLKANNLKNYLLKSIYQKYKGEYSSFIVKIKFRINEKV